MCDSLHGWCTVIYNLAGRRYEPLLLCSFNVHNLTLRGSTCSMYYSTTNTPVIGLVSRILMLSRGIVALPDEIMYKALYPIEGYSQDGQLLSRFLGQFGITHR